jgi:hypothetical protein
MSVARKPTSTPRLVAAGFAVSLAVIGLFWLAWAAYWWIEQRW